MLYSVVVPVYNSEHTLEDLHRRLVKVFDEELKLPFELLLVDDSSKDRSFEVMKKLREEDKRVHIFQMARNFGQHNALLCGFHYVEGDFVITMDDDLQHPPEELPKMIRYLDEHEEIDVVLGRYQNRKHSFFRRLGTSVSSRFTTKMLPGHNHPSPADRQSAAHDFKPHRQHRCAA